MYPTWGKYGGGAQHPPPVPQNYGGSPHPVRGTAPVGGGYGGYGPPGGSFTRGPAPSQGNFQSLREQHLQQMQQLQQLHQKQLQSVLHHNSSPYGVGGCSPDAWQGSSAGPPPPGPGVGDGVSSGPSYQQHQQPQHQMHHPLLQQQPQHQQHHQQQQPPPPLPAPAPTPPPPSQAQQQQHRPVDPKPPAQPPPDTNPINAPDQPNKNINNKYNESAQQQDNSDEKQEQSPDLSSMSLQEQQQYWYKQHLQSLQKLKQQQKNEKAKASKLPGDQPPDNKQPAPPPPMEPPKKEPPPPPPKEEPPPPPPPEESKATSVTSLEDPVEAARLQHLQAAAAQWQQTQQQRTGYQYQAMMQQHAQLQQLLAQYQQFMQQPAHFQTMPMDMQLRHYEMQQQQFIPLYQEWNRQFLIWEEQFQTYPHKDQLREYGSQWKQWQEQMKSTSSHLQERLTTLRNMQHQFVSPPYVGNMVGVPQYGHYHQAAPGGPVPPPVASVPPLPPKTPAVTPPAPMPQGPPPAPVPQCPPPAPVPQGPPPAPVTQGPPPAPMPQGPPPALPAPPGKVSTQVNAQVSPVTTALAEAKSGTSSVTGKSATSSASTSSSSSSSSVSTSAGPTAPGLRPSGVLHTTNKVTRFEGPRGPRFDGPRGRGSPSSGPPPRFVQQHRFDQPPRSEQPSRFGAPNKFDQSTKIQNQPPKSDASGPPVLKPQDGQIEGSDTKISKFEDQCLKRPVTTSEDQRDSDVGDSTSCLSVTEDLLDSDCGFFIPNDPIPQRVGPVEKPKQSGGQAPKKLPASDTAKPTPLTASAETQKEPSTNKNTLKPGEDKYKTGVQGGLKGTEQLPKKTVPSKSPPKFSAVDSRNTSMAPKGLGRGQPAFSKIKSVGVAPNPKPFDYRPPYMEGSKDRSQDQENSNAWGDSTIDRHGAEREQMPPRNEMWGGEQDEEEPFREHYYEGRDRESPLLERELLDDFGRERPWGEPEPEYWEDRDPYWREERPPFRRHSPLPHEAMDRGPPRRHLEVMDRDPRGPPSLPHDVMDRDPRGPPSLPHDVMDRDPRGPPSVPHDVMDRVPRHPPLPHEALDRGPHSLPHGAMDRDPRRPLLPHEIMERDSRRDSYYRDYKQELDSEPGRYGRPYPDYHSRDYERDQEYYRPKVEWEMKERGRDYPPYPPRLPSEHVREERWINERDRDYLYERVMRERGDMRVREYPEGPGYRTEERDYPPGRPEWGREVLPERSYIPEIDDQRPPFEDYLEDAPPGQSPAILPPATNLPPQPGDTSESLMDESSNTAQNVLALSQRQHDIILKAAQELKMLRERQEQLQVLNDFIKHDPADPVAQPGAVGTGMVGMQVHPSVTAAFQASQGPESGLVSTGTELLAHTEEKNWGRDNVHNLWDSGSGTQVTESSFGLSHAVQDHASLPASSLSKPPVIPKTVDYGHGRDVPTAKVEQRSYGERIVLRPDPVPVERTYEKELLIPRDYERDPYFERRGDPYLERREYGRERERERDPYFEKPPMDYERERYERDRYSREERFPPGSLSRSVDRERERDRSRDGERDREGRDSRDRDSKDHRDSKERFSRSVHDRPPYERGPDRPPYDHGHPGYGGDSRGYPEERMPVPAPCLPHPPPPQPRVEKKPEMKNVDDILKPPGRESRPERMVVIMRGLPGSGKTHVAKLIRDKEVEYGGAPPRVLGLDDYFMTEVEKVEKDPDTGRRIKKKVLEYEYEPEMEDTYRSSMIKTFRKTLDDGFFPFIIIDAINDRVKYFDQFWSAAKTKGFEVYLAEISTDNQTCAKRNIHGRKLKDITKMAHNWETAPRHMVRLDIRSLLQDAAIEEVEMEDFDPAEEEQKVETKDEDIKEEEGDLGYIPKSKWEMDTSGAKLDKLDGLRSSNKRKRDSGRMSGMEDYLQLPDDYETRRSEPGKKRVRWADLEEKKDADRKRAIGFVVGQTDWEKITDETGRLAQRALNRTKYF
ncbi:YLP motif-containing protein 1-like [Acipenser ruthenus]|uniref:YLP motif-containing protein 1-like n=1 Tax=Acipenser ruthenus TaxID=7906 RepID=UPI00145A4FAB|nr:YLP motif-containing protein 1-like [Acipenser ruthenus]